MAILLSEETAARHQKRSHGRELRFLSAPQHISSSAGERWRCWSLRPCLSNCAPSWSRTLNPTLCLPCKSATLFCKTLAKTSTCVETRSSSFLYPRRHRNDDNTDRQTRGGQLTWELGKGWRGNVDNGTLHTWPWPVDHVACTNRRRSWSDELPGGRARERTHHTRRASSRAIGSGCRDSRHVPQVEWKMNSIVLNISHKLETTINKPRTHEWHFLDSKHVVSNVTMKCMSGEYDRKCTLSLHTIMNREDPTKTSK